jgi:hypothetical protein
MNAQAADAPRVDEATGTVTYEQPLAERMRTFLRLEFLAQQANHHSLQASTWSSRAAIGSLLEILTILGRGDIRGEVLKELERQAAHLAPYVTRPGVDKSRLETPLERVSDLRVRLAEVGAHYAQPLKESEFLSAIKHRSAIPGGTCEWPAAGRQARIVPACARERDASAVAEGDDAGALRGLPRDQRQSASLHHPLPQLGRHRGAAGADRGRRQLRTRVLLKV